MTTRWSRSTMHSPCGMVAIAVSIRVWREPDASDATRLTPSTAAAALAMAMESALGESDRAMTGTVGSGKIWAAPMAVK